MAKRKKKREKAKIDGLGPDDLRRIHKALGQVRTWSYPVRLVRARAVDKQGFPVCEGKAHKGKRRVPKIQIDHLDPIGEIGGPCYIDKMFVSSKRLQALCKKCHGPKTRAETKERNRLLALRFPEQEIDDFT